MVPMASEDRAVGALRFEAGYLVDLTGPEVAFQPRENGCESKSMMTVEQRERPPLELSVTIHSDDAPRCENCRNAETSRYGNSAR